MSKLLNLTKTCALLGGITILGVSALPQDADAQLDQDPVICSSVGSSCKIIFDNHIDYYRLQE